MWAVNRLRPLAGWGLICGMCALLAIVTSSQPLLKGDVDFDAVVGCGNESLPSGKTRTTSVTFSGLCSLFCFCGSVPLWRTLLRCLVSGQNGTDFLLSGCVALG